MSYIISGLILFSLTLATTYLTQKYQARPIMKIIIPAFVAVVVFLGNIIIEKIGEKWNKPIFTMETAVTDKTVSVYLTLKDENLSTWAINYPVRGRIIRIADMNSATDVRTVFMGSLGMQKPVSLNHPEIDVENIRENSKLQYDIIYEPNKHLPEIPPFVREFLSRAIDRYKATYTWNYKGNEYSKTEWRLVKNDQITEPPGVEMRDMQLYDRALTEEEIQKNFRELQQKRGLKETFK